jgi:hypothetical protein
LQYLRGPLKINVKIWEIKMMQCKEKYGLPYTMTEGNLKHMFKHYNSANANADMVFGLFSVIIYYW